MRQAAQITMAHLQLGAEQAGLAEEAEMQTEHVYATKHRSSTHAADRH